MRYLIVSHIPFAVSQDHYLVDNLWAWELESFVNASDKFQIEVFAPETSKDKIKFPYKIPKKDIEFNSLPYFEALYYCLPHFLIKLPIIVLIFLKKFHKKDVVYLSGLACPPLGQIAGLCCIIKGIKNRVVVFDADFIGDLDLLISSEKITIKKFLLMSIKKFYQFIFYLQIKSARITFVFGDKLYERYGNNKNVIKTCASWIKKRDIIKEGQLEIKIKNSLKRECIKLCFMGSLTEKKNPWYALEVVKILKRNNISFSLDIWGEGPLEHKLRERVKHENLVDKISFRGVSPYGEEFYKNLMQYDVILVTNLSGEQPRILFDALANGVIVVGSDIKSFSSIINDGINGFLCDINDPKSFATVIERIYDKIILKKDKKFIEKIVFNGIKTVNNNTMESIYKKRIEIIEKSMNNK